MNFFEAQDHARRQTGWLVLLFGLAVAGLIVLTNLLLLVVLAFSQSGQFVLSPDLLLQQFQLDVFIGVAVVVLALVFLGSLYKTMTLSGGGANVAEMLGGRRISRDTHDLAQRQLLNVVEEMAIAAGMPVPPVYLLDETGINAFAAGSTPNTAVIGITQGALDAFSREELQGVIAHEFSHIFNGDMRLNIRLIGVLHGILLLGLLGYLLLRSSAFVRSSNKRGGGAIVAILALGAGLVVIGFVGHFFGQMIKAMVSRQREYLADASAVQFTRDKQSIAGALKKIGGASHGSLLDTPAAAEYSHAYFSKGVGGFMQSLLATHPPLPDRIKRIEPQWNGKYLAPVAKASTESTAETGAEFGAESGAKSGARSGAGSISGMPAGMPGGVVGGAVTGAVISAGVLSAEQMVDQVGTVSEQQVNTARDILAAIPAALHQAASEAYGARAVIYALLIDARAEVQSEQQRLLDELADPQVAATRETLMEYLPNLPDFARLPLLELTLPALQTLSPEQYQRFRNVVQALIAADKKVNLAEWILQRLVIQQLDLHFGLRKPPRAVHSQLSAVRHDLQVLLSLVAHTEYSADAQLASYAFAAAASKAGEPRLEILPREELNLSMLNKALDNLNKLKPLVKPRLLKACAACILHDGKTTIPAQELLRTIAICLDSPMPLLATSTG